jgi:hypothetical protein
LAPERFILVPGRSTDPGTSVGGESSGSRRVQEPSRDAVSA